MKTSEIFYYVVSLSLMGSILSISLLIIKRLLGQKLSAKWHYGIWFLLMARLLIPYTSHIPVNIFDIVPHYQKAVQLPQISAADTIGSNAAASIQDEGDSIGLPQVVSPEEDNIKPSNASPFATWVNWESLGFIWLIGIIAISIYIFSVNILMLLKVKKLPVCGSEDILKILQECKYRLNIHAKITVIYDDTIKSPAAFGLFSRRIIISPEIIKKLTPEELCYIFIHELSHIKRHDLLINGLALTIQVVYWFNPLIWYSLYQMKQDCEMACDATVLSALSQEDYKKYGLTIINLLQVISEPHWAPGTLGFVSKFNTRRIIMISKFKKTSIAWAIAALTLILLAGCSSLNNPIKAPNTGIGQNNNRVATPNDTAAITPTGTTDNSSQDTNADEPTSTPALSPSPAVSVSIIYKNTQYGFSFTLPKDWKGYSIVSSQWEGRALDEKYGQKVVAAGPIISIRDPRWTSKTPRQDIPVMVFTLDQWASLQKDAFSVSAAPVNPSELGRNNMYVFALPARYNFAFPPGYEEVEKIMESKPLKTTQVSNNSDSAKSLLLDMAVLAGKGKIINCDFAAKSNNIADVEKIWGKADKTDWVAAAKGNYAAYGKHNVVFGTNKGDQIFEVRSFDSRLKGISISKVKEVLGKPAYDVKRSGQEIIGYTSGSEFKIQMVFPQPTKANPDPVIDHYNVLYPQGTVNSMAGDPGRQW